MQVWPKIQSETLPISVQGLREREVLEDADNALAAYDAQPAEIQEYRISKTKGERNEYGAERHLQPSDIAEAEAATSENGDLIERKAVLREFDEYVSGLGWTASDAGAHNDKRNAELARNAIGEILGLKSMVEALSTHQQQGAESEDYVPPPLKTRTVMVKPVFVGKAEPYPHQDDDDDPCRAPQPDTVTELLERVRDFHYGRGKFNFSHLSDDQRSNVSFDAWQIIQGEIDAALAARGK